MTDNWNMFDYTPDAFVVTQLKHWIWRELKTDPQPGQIIDQAPSEFHQLHAEGRDVLYFTLSLKPVTTGTVKKQLRVELTTAAHLTRLTWMTSFTPDVDTAEKKDKPKKLLINN